MLVGLSCKESSSIFVAFFHLSTANLQCFVFLLVIGHAIESEHVCSFCAGAIMDSYTRKSKVSEREY